MSIAEQNKGTQELLHSPAYLAGVVESAAYAILAIDAHEKIVLFNGAAEAMFRCSAAQALGQSCTQFLPEALCDQHRAWVRGVGDGTAAPRQMEPLNEVAGVRADGSRFLAEASILRSTADGERYLTALLRDVTARHQALESIRASEELLRSLYKSLPVPTYSWQWREGDFVLVGFSDTAEIVAGGSLSGLLNAKIGHIFAHSADIAADLRQCHAEKRTIHRKCVYNFLPTGRNADIDATYVFVPPDTVLAHAYDVTEQRENEQALIKLSSVAEQTADAVIITNRDGVIEYVNPAFENLTGYRSGEMVGHKPNVLKSGKVAQEYFEELWQTILAGKAFRGLFLNRKKNGDLFYEEKTISPLKNARGEITHFISVGRDKTAQMQASEEERRLRAALENAAREWRLTFDAVESAILLTDVEGSIRRLNRPASVLLNLGFEAAIGCRISQFCPSEPWQTVQTVMAEAREWRQASSRQIRDARSGKSWQVTVSRFVDPAMEREQMIVTLRDVSATVELQESLRRSETLSAMGTLVAGVAHEVRNPLFSISATMDAFEARFGVQPEYVEYRRVLRQELNRMTGLMQELLDYGKPAVLHLVDTEASALVNHAVEACAHLAGKYNIEIRKVLAPDLPMVRVDAQRMAEVFRNVIENAIQHSPKGSKVTIEVRSLREVHQAWIECAVRDSGPGFDLEDLPRLFEPFFTRRRGGTGLGLAIAERAIEQHGGKIVARNHPEGGAEMVIRLQALAGDSSSREA
ncbi:MAG: PAS domain S-box protein [Acidobacteriia bacterium]|nr:PAS domain S-box protein [Terriglobia bacterium]